MDLLGTFRHALTITIFVFSMMVFVDWLNVVTRGEINKLIRGHKWRQYMISSFLGSTPGCLGAFMNVSFYVHGLIGFGALVGGMIATSGDEAYIMLSLFPVKAIALFAGLLVSGVVFGLAADLISKRLHIVPGQGCGLHKIHPNEIQTPDWRRLWHNLRHLSRLRASFLLLMVGLLAISSLGIVGPHRWDWMRVTLVVLLSLGTVFSLSTTRHYLKEHIVGHILREHIFRVFLWTFSVLLAMSFLPDPEIVSLFVREHIFWVFLLAGLLGVIPESGPHLVFVMLFSQGIVPFSVLFVSSFVQDGHGMLPLLSVSVRDSLRVKAFNLVFGLITGGILYTVGV